MGAVVGNGPILKDGGDVRRRRYTTKSGLSDQGHAEQGEEVVRLDTGLECCNQRCSGFGKEEMEISVEVKEGSGGDGRSGYVGGDTRDRPKRREGVDISIIQLLFRSESSLILVCFGCAGHQ